MKRVHNWHFRRFETMHALPKERSGVNYYAKLSALLARSRKIMMDMLGREIMLGKRNSQGIRGMIQEEECMSNVKVIEYSDFKNFYADILPSGKLWNKLKGFVFRGQSSDKYLLLPSALREKNYKKLRL